MLIIFEFQLKHFLKLSKTKKKLFKYVNLWNLIKTTYKATFYNHRKKKFTFLQIHIPDHIIYTQKKRFLLKSKEKSLIS